MPPSSGKTGGMDPTVCTLEGGADLLLLCEGFLSRRLRNLRGNSFMSTGIVAAELSDDAG